MKLQQKIIPVNFAIALLAGFLLALNDRACKASDYLVSFGIVGFFGGLLQLITGLFLLAKTDKRYAQGFLMSGGILMLVGFVTCTGNFSVH
jgi:succinate-acetate transporter protein